MKEKIHPEYKECKVTCGCGNTFVTRSTKAELHVEICSNCHPFYTGKQKFLDTAGRVEKFTKRHAWDDSTKGKVLEKEPAKKLPKKLEKVHVGLPPIRKRKAALEEEEGADERSTQAGAGGDAQGRGPGRGPGKGSARGAGKGAAKGAAKTDGAAPKATGETEPAAAAPKAGS